MSDSTNLAIGASVGAAAGAGAGSIIAKGIFKKNYPQYLQNFKQKDTFIAAQNKQPVQEFVQDAEALANAKFKEAGSKISEFNKNCAPVIKKALRTHWIVPLAAAGAAIGLGTAAVINKIKANNEPDNKQ